MGATFRLAGQDGHIQIDILGYEKPGAKEADEANWLLCSVSVAAGTFSGEFNSSFLTTDFVDFLQECAQIIEKSGGAAQLAHIEEALRVEVALSSDGSVKVTGQAKVLDVSQTVLSFVFPSDKKSLTAACAQLEEAVRKFPVR